ncbi:hypothetical protein KIPE111705_41255 [Kibdelosporangium persicum]
MHARDPPLPTEHVAQRLADQVDVPRVRQAARQRRRGVRDHDGVAVDALHGRVGEHGLGAPAARLTPDFPEQLRPDPANGRRVHRTRLRGRCGHRFRLRRGSRGRWRRRRLLSHRRGNGFRRGPGRGSGLRCGSGLSKGRNGGSGDGRDRGTLLQLLKPLQHSGIKRRIALYRGGQEHSRAQQLHHQTRRRRPAHLDQSCVDDLGEPGQRGRADPVGLRAHPAEFVTGHVHQPARAGIRNGTEQNQITQPVEQVRGEPSRVVPRVDEPLDRAVHGRGVAGRQTVDHVVDQRDVGDAQQRDRALVRHPVRTGTGQQLVHDGLRVPGRAAARPDDQREHRRLDRDTLGRAVALQQLPHHARRDQPERVVVGTGADGRQDLVRLGGGEDEDEVLGWLLHDLQQGVETLRGDHVGLVDDEDPVARDRRSEERPVPQLTRVVDTTVAGRVQFDHVDTARPVRRQRDARLAHTTRIGRRPLLAVERPGHDPRTGRLAAAARPGEQVRVIDPTGRERRAQRLGDVLLTDHLSEGRRTVLAVEGERHGGDPTQGHRQSRRQDLFAGSLH